MYIFSVSVRFDVSWLLSDKCPQSTQVVNDVITALKKRFESKRVVVEKISYHMCTAMIVCDEPINAGELQQYLISELKYCNGEECLFVKIEIKTEEEFKKVLAASQPEGESREFIKGALNIDGEDEARKTAAGITSDNTSSVEGLVGVDAFKKWADEINAIGKVHKNLALQSNVLSNCAFLMSINRGNGLSSILHLMAYTLMQNNLFTFSNKDCAVIEHHLEYPESGRPEEFPSFDRLLGRVFSDNGVFGGIIAINIEEWIDNLYDKKLDKVLDFVWNLRNRILFVFTIPYADVSVVEKIEARIKDIMSVRTMKFVPPSDNDYFEFFKKFFKKFSIDVDDEVKNHFVTAVAEEKNDGKFYGFNTIKKISNEVLYRIIADTAKENAPLPTKITEEMFVNSLGMNSEMSGLSGVEQLEGMVALSEVKSKVREILLTAKLEREMFLSGKTDSIRPCYHMMFSGNPGTGKTVVARIIGRIFKEEGLLSVGNFFEVSRKDFVGKFVGHTAPKTMEICRNAIGSVLFIDEAYTLANDNDGFSSEAIGTLIAEMENHRDDMVVIFAGYEKELETLFNMNPGLRDRIPNKIHFPNYSRDELCEIFFLNLRNKIKYDDTFKASAERFFKEFPEEVLNMRDFSNGRFVRNLAERIISKSALRFEMSGESIDEFCLCANDFDIAVSDNDYSRLFVKKAKTSRIGY